MKSYLFTLFLITTAFGAAFSQDNFPINGVHDDRRELYAFIHATLFVDHSTRIENATLVTEDGFVTAVGTGIKIPEGAVVVNLDGYYIYPGLIDLYTNYGMPEIKSSGPVSGPPQYQSDRKKGPFGWNDAIHSERKAVDMVELREDEAKKLRNQGISSVLTFLHDGIVRGSSVLINLIDHPIQESIVLREATAQYSLDKGSSTQVYPTSGMGVIALLRQTYYDAAWYQSARNTKQTNLSLQYFNDLQTLPQVFEVTDKFELLRLSDLEEEFNISYIAKGAGDEYQRIREIKATGIPLIIPVNFPEAFDLKNPDDALQVDLKDMKHWEMAPANLSFIEKAGIPFAITSGGLEDPENFLENIRKAIRYGLSEGGALRALTETPANLVNAGDRLGSLKPGRYANLLVTSDSLFKEGTVLFENWVQGNRYVIHDRHLAALQGIYDLEVDGNAYDLILSLEEGVLKSSVRSDDSTKIKAESDFTDGNVFIAFKPNKAASLRYRLSGWESGNGFKGDGYTEKGDRIFWNAVFREPLNENDTTTGEAKLDSVTIGELIYPFTDYGWRKMPEKERVLFKNATVWTNEAEGILKEADVLVDNGKIIGVGKDLEDNNARIVDLTGKHLTSGIIDEHSHIALTSVNEHSQAVTSEVRMKDVLNAEDIDIYWQLAGGVTAAQLLHGSANPIGGQSAIIKFRWGEAPGGLLIQGADPFIKFALGENVKQSNAGDEYSTRFPQTRMGVEQVMVDAFTRAESYRESREEYEALNKKQRMDTPEPRKDLELEALAEILDHKRFITCHSYVQSEINMLIKVADQFGFTVNTFTHILEGYKVADKMLEHGAGGSSFSDWWAYKYEVREAIPYNAALMNQVGVVTAINSDDAEMARRLNQEAAKTVKYGGVTEEDAWKMVTLNPARLLHLDERMGSIKEGKDADLVIWSENPLSIYARAEKTMVDGAFYYDMDDDAERRTWIRNERARLIEKMEQAGKNGEKVKTPVKKFRVRWDCGDMLINND